MRLFLALIFSATIHIVAVFLIFNISGVENFLRLPNDNHIFQVVLVPAINKPDLLPKKLINLNAREVAQDKSEREQDINNYELEKNLLNTNRMNDSQVGNEFMNNYFSTQDVEMKALPISNLDISMFNGEFISGMPVSLRLYINASGKVVKIVRIDHFEQNAKFVGHLEELLFQLTFLPAKKAGVEVNSYQDIQFGFN